MDILALKELLRPVVGNLKDHCTNEKIPDLCRHLGLTCSPQIDAYRC